MTVCKSAFILFCLKISIRRRNKRPWKTWIINIISPTVWHYLLGYKDGLVISLLDLTAHPSCVSLCWKAGRQENEHFSSMQSPSFFDVFPLKRSQIENFRSCTATPMAAARQTPESSFCWIVVSCEPFTLRNTYWQNPKYQLLHYPVHMT